MEIFQTTEENPDPPTNQGAYQFNQIVKILSEEITIMSSKFNKNTVQSANPLDLILKIT